METVYLQRITTDVPWGFRLFGGCDYSQPLTVQKVTAGSVASGNLQAGDIISRIGDEETSSMTQMYAMQIIKDSGNSLQLGIQRNSATTQYQNNDLTSPGPQLYQELISPLQFDHQLSLGSTPDNHHHNVSDNWSNNTHDQPQQKMPDAILNMAAKGDGSSKKPFSYVADINDIQMQREKVKKRSAAYQAIPRYQNILNMPQFEDPPRARGLNKFIVPTSPPPQPSGDAVVANLQFNSPLQMYSSDNVIESLKGQTGAEIKGVVGLPAKEKADITQSPVYKMIHGIDQPKPRPAISYAEARSAEVEKGEEEHDGAIDYPQKSIRYTGNNIPSRSFKMLQNMTTGDNKPPSAALKYQAPVQAKQHQQRQPTGNFRSPDLYQQAYQGQPSQYYGGVRGGSMERREGSSEVDTTSIYQHLRGTPSSDAGDYNEKSVRYVGKSIPSKCFRLLQDMTGGPKENDASPGLHKRRPPHLASPQTHSDVEHSDDGRQRNMRYTGNNIPSRSFKMLQRHSGDGHQYSSPSPSHVSLPHQLVEEQESTDF